MKTSKTLNIALWVSQALIALMVIPAGAMKLFQPIESLSQMLPWTGDIPSVAVRLLGLADLALGFGIFLPMVLRIKPQLTLWAAYGGIALMASAIIFHFSRGEGGVTGFNFFLTAILAFVIWGRQKNIKPVYTTA